MSEAAFDIVTGTIKTLAVNSNLNNDAVDEACDMAGKENLMISLLL